MNETRDLWLLAALVGLPSIVAGATWWARRRGIAVASGWGGVVFVLMCLGLALASIAWRVAH